MASNRMSILAVVPLATVLFAASTCNAGEPQAEFTVDDGWVTALVTRDGVPMKGVQIKVSDGIGLTVATGETGPEGRGEFPLPPGQSFTVEITLGGKKADPVRLTRDGDGLFPGEVQLTFGLAPCCNTLSRGGAAGARRPPPTDTETDPASSWLLAAAVAGSAFVVSLIAVTVLLPRRGRP